jgi:hypothetical protein
MMGGKSIIYLENSMPSGSQLVVAGSKITRLCSACATARGVFYIGGRGLQQGVGYNRAWATTGRGPIVPMAEYKSYHRALLLLL